MTLETLGSLNVNGTLISLQERLTASEDGGVDVASDLQLHVGGLAIPLDAVNIRQMRRLLADADRRAELRAHQAALRRNLTLDL